MQEDSRKGMAQFGEDIHFLGSHGHPVNQNESAVSVVYFNFGMAAPIKPHALAEEAASRSSIFKTWFDERG